MAVPKVIVDIVHRPTAEAFTYVADRKQLLCSCVWRIF